MAKYPIYGAVVFGAIILLAGWRARATPRRVGAALWVCAAAAFAAGDFFVARQARPGLHDVQPGVSVLYRVVTGFPSPIGAAAMAGAVAAGLCLVHGRAAVAATVAAAAMAVFQVWVVAHAWQDVVAGFVFGIAIMGGGYAILDGPLARAGSTLVRAGSLMHAGGGRGAAYSARQPHGPVPPPN